MTNERPKGTLERCLFAVVVMCAVAANAHSPAEDMEKAANAWLKSAGDLNSKAVFELQSPERENWSYLPASRKGASLGEMSPAQRELALCLLQSALSHRGYLQATTIVSLELVLREMETNPNRDPEKYFLSIFGQPDAGATWGWRFEGHHLSLNFLIVGGKQVTVAPSFFGSNPAEGSRNGNHVRPLAAEEDLARSFIKSLSLEQRRKAVFSEAAPREIITGTRHRVEKLEPLGICFSDLIPAQQSDLRKLVELYVNRYQPELADEDLSRIRAAGWDKVWFAWAGALEKGEGHYYRLQGPTFLLEYDNTQNNANHIHTVWRDLKRDFGGDLLQEHYRNSPHRAVDRRKP